MALMFLLTLQLIVFQKENIHTKTASKFLLEPKSFFSNSFITH